MKKAITLILVCVMLCGTIAMAADSDIPEKEPLSEELYASVYNPAKYELDYEPGEVRVRLQKYVTMTSGYEELFPELDISNIRTEFTRYYLKGMMDRQLIVLELTEKTRESVISAIELLKNNYYVYYSQPNYIGQAAQGDPIPDPIPTPAEKGDINCDGNVGNDDLILVARYLVKYFTLDGIYFKAADMDDDGSVDNSDLIRIAKNIVNI